MKHLPANGKQTQTRQRMRLRFNIGIFLESALQSPLAPGIDPLSRFMGSFRDALSLNRGVRRWRWLRNRSD